MNTQSTTYAVRFTTFLFNGHYIVRGTRQTKWYASEAEIPVKYSSCIGRKYNDETPSERWDGTLIVRTT